MLDVEWCSIRELNAKAAPGYIGLRDRNQEPPAERGLDVNLSAPRKGERAGKPARHTFFDFNRGRTLWEGEYEPRA